MDPQLSKEAENDIRSLIAYGLQTFGETDVTSGYTWLRKDTSLTSTFHICALSY